MSSSEKQPAPKIPVRLSQVSTLEHARFCQDLPIISKKHEKLKSMKTS